MALLSINGTEYQGKCNFAFDQVADEKYNDEDGKGNKMGGFMNIYMKLMADDLKGLLAFWDCAVSEHGKKRPSVKEIEAELMQIIDDEENGEAAVDQLFKDAFKAVHNSGFYRKQTKRVWKNFAELETKGETKEKQESNKKIYQEMLETKEALLA